MKAGWWNILRSQRGYQIANDIAEFNGNDEVQIVAGDLAQRRPNAVVLAFANNWITKDMNNSRTGSSVETANSLINGLKHSWLGSRRSQRQK